MSDTTGAELDQFVLHLVEQLGLTYRRALPLVNAGITDATQLADWTQDDLLNIRGVGWTDHLKVIAALRAFGIELNAEGVLDHSGQSQDRSTERGKRPHAARQRAEDVERAREELRLQRAERRRQVEQRHWLTKWQRERKAREREERTRLRVEERRRRAQERREEQAHRRAAIKARKAWKAAQREVRRADPLAWDGVLISAVESRERWARIADLADQAEALIDGGNGRRLDAHDIPSRSWPPRGRIPFGTMCDIWAAEKSFGGPPRRLP